MSYTYGRVLRAGVGVSSAGGQDREPVQVQLHRVDAEISQTRHVIEELQHHLPLPRLAGQQVEEAASPGAGKTLTQDQRPQRLHHGPDRGRLTARSHQLLLLPRAVQTPAQSGQGALRTGPGTFL